MRGVVLPWLAAVVVGSGSTPGAAAQEPPRLMGLVELPGLFGTVDPDGPPGAVAPERIRPVPLHVEPGADRAFRLIDARELLEWAEHDYEAPAAKAYGMRDDWVLVAITDGSGYGWVPPGHTGRLHRLEALLTDGLAYLTTDWNGELREVPATDAPSVRFARSTPDADRSANVLEAVEHDGVLWLRVELLGPGRCETVGPIPVDATGWIPALAGDGRPNAWFYSRGC